MTLVMFECNKVIPRAPDIIPKCRNIRTMQGQQCPFAGHPTYLNAGKAIPNSASHDSTDKWRGTKLMAGTTNTVAIKYESVYATVVCIVCGDTMGKLWYCNGYCYFSCPTCEFVRVAPVPPRETLKDYYAKSYAVDIKSYRRNICKHAPHDLGTLEKMKRSGRMLEVGCSWGLFLDAARQRGWDVRGIELSDSAAKWANDRLGLNVTCGTMEDLAYSEEVAFDVIAAWHVIEHVREPTEFLKLARQRLQPGGLLALRTPNIRSLPARINGWAWQWVGAPAHLSLFSPRSLAVAVERAGFSVRYVATRRGDAYNPVFELVRGGALRAGLHQLIKRVLKLPGTNRAAIADEEFTRSDRRRRILERLIRLFDVMFFAAYPLEKLFEFMGWGPELFLIAQRKD